MWAVADEVTEHALINRCHRNDDPSIKGVARHDALLLAVTDRVTKRYPMQRSDQNGHPAAKGGNCDL